MWGNVWYVWHLGVYFPGAHRSLVLKCGFSVSGGRVLWAWPVALSPELHLDTWILRGCPLPQPPTPPSLSFPCQAGREVDCASGAVPCCMQRRMLAEPLLSSRLWAGWSRVLPNPLCAIRVHRGGETQRGQVTCSGAHSLSNREPKELRP